MQRAVFNQKGGVGKTSITCNLAAAFAKAGRRVLVVDLDAQANASQYLLGDAITEVTKTVADFFESTLSFKLFKETLREAVYPTPWAGLSVVAADKSLGELQPKLEGRYKIFKLREAIAGLTQDLGITDVFYHTPPALNFYAMSALIASDRVLIPFDCDAFSAEALATVMDVIQEVASDHQPQLQAEGVIINHFQAGAKVPQAAIDRLIAQSFPVLTPYLSGSVVMRESHGAHAPLAFFKPKHKLAEEYAALAARLMAADATTTPTAPSPARERAPRAKA
jgi:chromosome partitioning protein